MNDVELRALEDEQMRKFKDKLWEQFVKRYMAARGVADEWRDLLEACYHFALPSKNRFYQPSEQQGEIKGSRVYDTTAIDATRTFVSEIHDSVTPIGEQWAYGKVDEGDIDEDDQEAIKEQQQLDDYMRKFFFYIHNSNFDTVVNECYQDIAVGTAALIVNSFTDDDPLLFTSVPIDKLCIEEALTGKIESWYREWNNIKINEINIRWPGAQLTYEMIQDVTFNPDCKIEKLYEGVMYCPQFGKKPYVYMIGYQDQWLLCEMLETNPGIVWRLQKVNSEVFGRGPVMDALPSIISLNELARIEFASANLNTFRPYMAFSDSVFNPNTFELEPMTVIPIAPIGMSSSPPLIPLPDTGNPQFGEMKITDLRNQIKTLLYNDVIQSESVQPQPATRFVLSDKKIAKKLGPLEARLQHEFLWPTLRRCANILDKRGILRKPKFKNKSYRFKYNSPLKLQKDSEEMSRFVEWYQLMQGIFGPEGAAIYINAKTTPYKIFEKLQLNSDWVNSSEDVQKVAQDMSEDVGAAQQQEQEMQSQELANQQQEQIQKQLFQ